MGPETSAPVGRQAGASFDAAELERWAACLLEAAGASRASARATAAACVDADRRGLDSHGVVYLDVYVRRLRAGIVDGSGEPEVLCDADAIALVDGHFALGAYVAEVAMGWCCEAAARHGLAAAVTRRSSHFGAASCYTEMAARRGLLGLVLCNSDPGLAPAGALEPLLGTNPVAMAAPSAVLAHRASLDMASSVVAQGKISAAARRGDRIPLDWAIGPDGLPTEDPEAALANAALPMGGHKGFALSFMVDVLTGCLGGGAISPELREERGAGQLFLAISVDALGARADFEERLGRLVEAVHEAPRAPGVPAFLIPGEREARFAAAQGERIWLDIGTVRLLADLGAGLGVALPHPTASGAGRAAPAAASTSGPSRIEGRGMAAGPGRGW